LGCRDFSYRGFFGYLPKYDSLALDLAGEDDASIKDNSLTPITGIIIIIIIVVVAVVAIIE
jgi:hypothetical protein